MLAQAGYAVVEPYWPDQLRAGLHVLIHCLGWASLVGLPLVTLSTWWRRHRRSS